MFSSTLSRNLSRRAQQVSLRNSRRRFLSTEEKATEGQDFQTQVANISLASALVGFCGFVFTYSMNAVGRGDANGSADPLAQLKAEAQEAREDRERNNAKRLSADEIHALESGMNARGTLEDGTKVEIAVAAPEDIARLEEEANLKVFQKNGSDAEAPKKKPWWRFGF
eukprot:Nitzschia sp. Nitz4//scaffold78_size91513//53209//53712//NITZ4_004931-RA/size91513-processed-gene-0.92-mRNA-1//-1//CDS//3329558136//1386//frame0